jgi:hypothetical protein
MVVYKLEKSNVLMAMQTSCIGFSRIKDWKLAQTFNSSFRCHPTILDSVSICISYSNKTEVKDTTNSQQFRNS